MQHFQMFPNSPETVITINYNSHYSQYTIDKLENLKPHWFLYLLDCEDSLSDTFSYSKKMR